MIEKSTIQKEIHLSGIGVHSGNNVDLILKPSYTGQILFRRTDLDNLEFSLDSKKIETLSSTSLTGEDYKIQTIEHLMAVLYAFGIDSVIIELNGNEIPIMDGSASPFVQAILKAGIKLLPEKKKVIKILKPFIIEEKEASVSFYPDSDFKISYCIEYDHPAIQRQELSLSINLKNFVTEIAPARTFGFLKDVPALRAQGLALGGSFDNAVVLDEKKVISGPLRYTKEFVRHKILDLIGDLSLLGSPILGHFKAHKAGHALHLKAINFILDSPEFWVYDEKSFPSSLMNSADDILKPEEK
ncbi:MAG: UDP-3-O-[3-hydroxymyristoyl] N-acetylglucosamine deacetylase [Candidatus Aminicenantes bacterium]|nr:MAG: UDP-3-O-[3-hydroxymyristoyl] N-acetylglucosamine deacetylase [Candidatus Aminicenantes bacterium]